MKPIYKYIASSFKIIVIAIFGAIIAIFIMRSCGDPEPTQPINTTQVLAKEAKIQEKKQEATVIHDSVDRWRDRWHAAKTLTVTLPCEEVLPIVVNTCDSLNKYQDSLNNAHKAIIASQDSVISDWHTIHSQDSMLLVKANKEVKRQKRKVVLWKVVAGISAGLNLVPR